MMLRKEDVVKKLTDGIAYLFKKNEIERVHGTAVLKGVNAAGQHQVEVALAVPPPVSNSQQTLLEPVPQSTVILTAPKVILATGSEASALPGIPFDGQVVVTAREALSFDKRAGASGRGRRRLYRT